MVDGIGDDKFEVGMLMIDRIVAVRAKLYEAESTAKDISILEDKMELMYEENLRCVPSSRVRRIPILLYEAICGMPSMCLYINRDERAKAALDRLVAATLTTIKDQYGKN